MRRFATSWTPRSMPAVGAVRAGAARRHPTQRGRDVCAHWCARRRGRRSLRRCPEDLTPIATEGVSTGPSADGVHVFLHGGGFWLSSVDEAVNDAICRSRCRSVGCVVVAVDYRLAPEHPFPAAVQDCLAGLEWAAQHAHEFDADRSRLSVGGVSAGGNLAAAVALAAARQGGPDLLLQLLEVPVLDLTLDTMRSSRVGDDFGITVAEMEMANELYLRVADDARNPLASRCLPRICAGLRRPTS